MAETNIVAFKTATVREMTPAEYREQRRRVIASLCTRDGRERMQEVAPPAFERAA